MRYADKMRYAGETAGYSDGQAVAAVVGFRDYGSDLYFVPQEFTSPTLTSYRLVTTPVLAAGVYNVSLAGLLTGSHSGTDIDADVEIDGVPLGLVLAEANRIGGGFLLSATVPQVWAAGSHTIDYLCAQAPSPGGSAVTVVEAITTWVREA